MLTFFALPKPFEGHNGIIQMNAIQSWIKLFPDCEIILFGDENGTSQVAGKLGMDHVANIGCNEYGTPLISSLFETARDKAKHDLICYVNSDIILTSSFSAAVDQALKMPSLTVGRRWDMNITEPLDFADRNWESRLLTRLEEEGQQHSRYGIDYFLFPRETYQRIPPFAIGRTAWDNWLIYKVRTLGLPVVDASRLATIIHQNHDFSHIKTITASSSRYQKGIEGEINRKLLGDEHHLFGLMDATHVLTKTGLKPALTSGAYYVFYAILRLPEMHPKLIPLVPLIRLLRWTYHKLAKVKRTLTEKRGQTRRQ